ncbi:crotonase/enoyl-CoA hydratase family protein [Parasphingorhabdus sp.]|uniref:crotonase/enoyl-CoA hydratase family protein n=1 Tax=Parasphingorhabdus sp. TaxID=2709688 RepID=UPI003A94C882
MTVAFETRENIAIVTIDRPERRNAVDGPTAQLLFDAFEHFDRDESLSVAILRGAGGNFCAGADLKAVAAGAGNRVEETGPLAPMGPTRMQLSKPVIAAVEGFAVAGGMELALWCDLRVMAKSARFGIFCRRFGVPLIDMGTVRLPRLIGQSRASDLILTGRELLAEEAFDIGLANRLADDGAALDTALELASQIAAFPQRCLRNDRRSMHEQWSLDHDSAMRNELLLGKETLRSGETLSGATAFTQGKGRHGAF